MKDPVQEAVAGFISTLGVSLTQCSSGHPPPQRKTPNAARRVRTARTSLVGNSPMRALQHEGGTIHTTNHFGVFPWTNMDLGDFQSICRALDNFTELQSHALSGSSFTGRAHSGAYGLGGPLMLSKSKGAQFCQRQR